MARRMQNSSSRISFFFSTPFVLQSCYRWFREALLDLILLFRFVVLVAVVLDGLWSWHFALQENPCRWFPRKIAILRSCLYIPSTSEDVRHRQPVRSRSPISQLCRPTV